MAPPIPLISLSDLEQHATAVQPQSPFATSPTQRLRKNNTPPPPRALTDCPLKEITQYKCNAEKPKGAKRPVVICDPVVRLFRVCANGMHVETTAWEEWKAGQLQQSGVKEGKTT
ncbi:unnamed protein product [Periconia digitata]|uniref:Uncharacterized protein n=1 Tax=Periconia digitata TaxID=1303443 RepID=A0A9W4UCW9_9PLEO|nr:unnamed protein product [Periconia digitata]